MSSRSLRLPTLLSLGLAAAACGDGDDIIVDAADDANLRIDAVPPPAGCDWAEGGEAHNDTSAEDTRLQAGASSVVFCGSLEARAPDEDGIIDNDAYSIEITEAGEYLLRLTIDDGEVDSFPGLDILDSFGDFYGGGYFAGGHAVAVASLDVGTYAFEAYTVGDAAPAAALSYHLSIEVDDRAARCGIAGASDFTEAGDGGDNRGNDVVAVTFSPDYSTTLTTTDDDPEATGLTATATDLVLAGSSANLTDGDDEYLDRDTYLIEVAAGTNQLDLRLAWDGDTADLDFLLFPVPGKGEEPFDFGGGLEVSNEDDEFASIAVEPGMYWLWIGAYGGSGGLPKPYDVLICPSTFTP